MRGRIIFVNPQTMTGLIFGADRQRYNFEMSEWGNPGTPARNLEVNFQAQGNEAVRIKPFAIDYADEPLYAKEKKSAVAADPSPKTRKAPKLSPPVIEPAVADTGLPFDDGTKLPTGVGADVTATRLSPGKKAPPLTLTAAEQAMLAEEQPTHRPTWQYYLIGIVASFVLLLLVFLVQLFMKHS